MVRTFSKTGIYHRQKGKENQDVVLSGENKRFQVITLADGVSSCEGAKEGAQIACEAVIQLFLQKGEYFLEFEKEKTAEFVVSHVKYELEEKARQNKKETDTYSSTLASVLFDKKSKKLLFFNLGDSLILGVKDGKCKIVAMPSDSMGGCCVTTTRSASRMVNTKVTDALLYDSILICSDGAWKEMFEKNHLRQEVSVMVAESDYDCLCNYLEFQKGFDDCSFISMNLK